MSVIAAYAVPHPPLIIPSVGKGKETIAQKTIDAYDRAAKEISALAPETIVFITPHAVMYADYFHISPSKKAAGGFSQFGGDTKLEVDYDEDFVDTLIKEAEKRGVSAGTLGERDNTLDHGVAVPLYFIKKYYTDFKAVRISISDMELTDHYDFGVIIAKTAKLLNKKTVFIASGDLSHKLSQTGPYGFDPEGPKLDAVIVDAFKTASFDKLLGISDIFAEKAAECGLNSFAAMAGVLHKKSVKSEVLSYEGPAGVGYAIASFLITGDDESRDFLEILTRSYIADANEHKEHEDRYVSYARYVVESYISTGKVPDIPDNLPPEMYDNEKRAGVFVSIKKTNNLRGCVGTISAIYNNIAEEIRANAISAAVGDSRFLPVTEDELPLLSYSVDVLMELEPVSSYDMLDVNKYGIVVRNKFKKGLLLPNLDGVNTVEEQIDIAKKKAGIGAREEFAIERFEVIRHK